MTITYFSSVVGVSPVLSEELAHIVPGGCLWHYIRIDNWLLHSFYVYIYIQDKYMYAYLKFTGYLLRTFSVFF